jgi:N-acetylglutamate synthase-like GNAT family acetyltransferase
VSVTIRDADVDDAEPVASLVAQLGYPASAETIRERLLRLAESEVDRFVVAERDGAVVGLAGLHVSHTIEYDGPAAKLSAIVVEETERRRGIGEALVAELEREARSRGCCLIFLTTAERRGGAHAFYRRVGFEETGRRFAKPL